MHGKGVRSSNIRVLINEEKSVEDKLLCTPHCPRYPDNCDNETVVAELSSPERIN